MKAATLIAILTVAAPAFAAEPTTLIGNVTKVRDGDTIEVGEIPICQNDGKAAMIRDMDHEYRAAVAGRVPRHRRRGDGAEE